MPPVAIRNVPEEVHRAIRVWAARHGRSIEAEMRDVLESAVKPKGRVRLGSVLADVGRRVKLTDEEFAIFGGADRGTSARAASFECFAGRQCRVGATAARARRPRH